MTYCVFFKSGNALCRTANTFPDLGEADKFARKLESEGKTEVEIRSYETLYGIPVVSFLPEKRPDK